MTQPDTLDAVLLRLAAMEKECPCITDMSSSCDFCGGITTPHSKRCENCPGTGRVPLLDPALMRAFQHPVGPTCLPGCRGWVLDPVTAALNLPEALVRAGYHPIIQWGTWREYSGAFTQGWHASVYSPTPHFVGATVSGMGVFFLALALAAEQALSK